MIRDIPSREGQALAKVQKLGKASEPMRYLSELVLKNESPSFRAALLCQHPQEHGMGVTEDTNQSEISPSQSTEGILPPRTWADHLINAA